MIRLIARLAAACIPTESDRIENRRCTTCWRLLTVPRTVAADVWCDRCVQRGSITPGPPGPPGPPGLPAPEAEQLRQALQAVPAADNIIDEYEAFGWMIYGGIE